MGNLVNSDFEAVLAEKGDTLNKIVTMTQAQAKDRAFTTVK